jgi:hypothetical protein
MIDMCTKMENGCVFHEAEGGLDPRPDRREGGLVLEKNGRFTLSFPAAESTAGKRRFVPYLFTTRFLPCPLFAAHRNPLNHHPHLKDLLVGHLRPRIYENGKSKSGAGATFTIEGASFPITVNHPLPDVVNVVPVAPVVGPG